MTRREHRSVALADARVEALAGLVDYAGLFPPAALDMAGAVAGYRQARDGDNAFMLGRFVCSAGRLEELAAVLVRTMWPGEASWPITALVDSAPGRFLVPSHGVALRDFATVMGGAAPVEAVDVKLDAAGADRDGVARLAGSLPAAVEVFFELAHGGEGTLRDALEEVDAARSERGMPIGAKLRCGGLSADLFPDVGRVAAFIAACRDLHLPFKATAGLHHPVRHRDPATGFVHHGFLNLLAAAALGVGRRLDESTIAAIVAEEDPAAFQVSRRVVRWRELEVGPAEVGAARRKLFAGYGSCNFDEPTGDLVAMGVLPIEGSK